MVSRRLGEAGTEACAGLQDAEQGAGPSDETGGDGGALPGRLRSDYEARQDTPLGPYTGRSRGSA